MRFESRRYRVSGVDSYGDIHIFESDDADRAAGMRRQFLEDLEDVEYLEEIPLDSAEGELAPRRVFRSDPAEPKA